MMSNGHRLAVIDTNVPIVANYAIKNSGQPDDLPTECISACVETIAAVIKNKGLVIDSGDEIYVEYRTNCSLKGQPGLGDRFMKWVHDNRWKLPGKNRVAITKNNGSYNEFPSHKGLSRFDRSDRKFVAVANAHPVKPPIYQATDSKWWGWKDALDEAGIRVIFLCSEYIKKKYRKKAR